MGAPHAVRWSKSFVFAFKQVFSYFSVTNRKKKKRQESRTKTCKNIQYKGSLPAFRSGVSNLLTKCAIILAKNLERAIIVQIFCDVLSGFRPGPGLFL